MSTLAINTFPSCLATTFSNLGPRILQGPHHLMEKEERGCQRRQAQQRLWKACWYDSAFTTIVVLLKSQPGNTVPEPRLKRNVSLTKALSTRFCLCVCGAAGGGDGEGKKRSPFSIHSAFDLILITPKSAPPALAVLLPPLLGPSSLPCVLAGGYAQSRDLRNTKLPQSGCHCRVQGSQPTLKSVYASHRAKDFPSALTAGFTEIPL